MEKLNDYVKIAQAAEIVGVPQTNERKYYEFRSSILRQNDVGLIDTYNRFDDPHEYSSKIPQLRELHAAMDRAVLEVYRWDDLTQTAICELLLDYEEEDGEPVAGKSKKKKPWRLR